MMRLTGLICRQMVSSSRQFTPNSQFCASQLSFQGLKSECFTANDKLYCLNRYVKVSNIAVEVDVQVLVFFVVLLFHFIIHQWLLVFCFGYLALFYFDHLSLGNICVDAELSPISLVIVLNLTVRQLGLSLLDASGLNFLHSDGPSIEETHSLKVQLHSFSFTKTDI